MYSYLLQPDTCLFFFFFPTETMCKVQKSPKTQGCCWSLNSPWWMKLHVVMCTFWASYWPSEDNVWESDLPHLGHVSYIPSQKATQLPTWVKTKRVSFFERFSWTLRKPQSALTPSRGSANEQRVMMSTPASCKEILHHCQGLLMLYDCLRVLHWWV